MDRSVGSMVDEAKGGIGGMPEKDKGELLDATSYYEKGNVYYEQGDYDRAIENYNMSVILNPNFLESYFNRALCYYNKKNYDKAIEDYTRAADIDPDNPLIYNNRGDAYYRKQDFEKSIADYNKAISLNKDYLKAFYNRGLAYACLQDYETAVENFTKVTEIDATFAEAYNARGLAYEYLEKYEEAVADYEKAIELNPEFAEAKEHLDAAKKKKSEKESGTSGEGVSAVKFMAKPKQTFKDVVGMTGVKELIKEYIVYPLKDPDLARKYGKFGGGGVIFYGPPGCGKCVTGDTKVLLADGNLKPIEEIYEAARRAAPELSDEHGLESAIERPGIRLHSLNKETLKIEQKEVAYVYKQRYAGKIFEIVTHSGRKIKVTPEHPFIAIDNGVNKVKAKELLKGAYVAIPREVNTAINSDPKYKELPQFVKVKTAEGELLQYITKRRPAKLFKPVYDVDRDTAELFGYLLSEGAASYGTMFFFNKDPKLIDRVSNLSETLFHVKPKIKPDTSQGVYKVEIGSVGLMRFLEHMHDFKLQGSRNTRVPAGILTAENGIVSAFLSAVFESEATVRKDVPEIEFSTASAAFADALSYLLLRFGIVARIRQKRIKNNDHIYWRLYISGHNQLKAFEKKIGFKSERKSERLARWTSRNIEAETNVDVIPNASLILRSAREAIQMNKSEFYNSKNGYKYEIGKKPSRSLLMKILRDKPDIEGLKLLRNLADSDVLWDRVVEIKESDIDGYVYDLTVDDNHTFIAGLGGIIVHNTYIMKAAAGEVGANFLNVKLSDVLDMYVGNTEKNIRNIFEAARKASPCIMFIDEIDGLGGKRDQMKESGQYMRMAVNQLLYEMDGVEARNENVLVVAATNSPWDVDPALRRAGRFTKMIYVGEPDYTSRKAMFEHYAKGRPVAKNVNWDRLARATEGYASSDTKAISDDAAAFPWLEALKTGKNREIKMSDYIMALDPFAADPIGYFTSGKKLRGKKSSLPPWYESAKKEIGKQEEVEVVEGKEIKRIKEAKMPAGEREYFSELINLIESRNKPMNKFMLWAWRFIALYQDYLMPVAIALLAVLLYQTFLFSA